MVLCYNVDENVKHWTKDKINGAKIVVFNFTQNSKIKNKKVKKHNSCWMEIEVNLTCYLMYKFHMVRLTNGVWSMVKAQQSCFTRFFSCHFGLNLNINIIGIIM